MDAQTRHRLVGIVLLLVLAALVTPVIFRSPEQIRVALDMELPPPPEVEPLPLAPVVTEEEIEQAHEQIDETQQQVVEAAEKRKDPKEAVPDTAIPSGWTLQVAALSSRDAADALVQKLRNADYAAYHRQVSNGGDTLYRVFVGPELERARSEQLREKLSRDLRFKLDGLVVPYAL